VLLSSREISSRIAALPRLGDSTSMKSVIGPPQKGAQMIMQDAFCPVHLGPLISVEEKPEYVAKCCYKACDFGILVNDSTGAIRSPSAEAAVA
jgi:hypothetical protein